MAYRIRFAVAVIVLCLCAASGPAADRKKPNVLLVISDDLNNAMGCYGAPVQTPNLDRLAARGVRFDRAYCQYPLCGPSRASFLSGMRPDKIGVLTNGKTVRDKRRDVVTLPELFRRNGYFSARVGKVYHLGIPGGVGTSGPDDPPSWDYTFHPKGAEFSTPGEEHDPTPQRPQGFRRVLGASAGIEQHDYQAADEAIRILREQKNSEKPFFLAVGFIRPHVPVIAPRTDFERYPVNTIALPKVPEDDRDDIPPPAFFDPLPMWGMNDSEARESIRAYYACISFMDAQAGRVLDALEAQGLKDDTIVVFTSDHGYLLGEHGTWQKMTLFEPVARVPLLIAGPGVTPASTTSLAEMIDLYPTLAELAGLTPPAELDGVSLVPVLRDATATVKEAAYTQLRRRNVVGRTVRTDRWRYTEWGGDGRAGVELYDEQADPSEHINLASNPSHEQTIATLKALLHASLLPATAGRP